MFDPELFGVFTTSQIVDIAKTLTLPTIGFIFLYLAGLPLDKWPLDISSSAKVPAGVLMVFALAAAIAMSFLLSAFAFLHLKRQDPAASVAQQEFEVIRRMPVPQSPLKKLDLTIDSYDGVSNFAVYLNSYRVFGTYSDCRLLNQCNSDAQLAKLDWWHNAWSPPMRGDDSTHKLRRLNRLPLAIDLTPLLTGKADTIEIHSTVSGTGGCRTTSTLRSLDDGGRMQSFVIAIDLNKDINERVDQALQTHETFGGGGTADLSEGAEIQPYRTRQAYHISRVCARILISIPEHERAFDQTVWRAKMIELRRRDICDGKGTQPEYC